MRLIDADALIESLMVDPVECYGCPEPEGLEDLINLLESAPEVRGECFHCGGRVIWCSDFDSEDYGLPEGGLIHECQCADCGARITYYVDIPEEADV